MAGVLPDAESLIAAVVVGDLSITSPASAAKIVRSAMESNYQWNGTDGGAIGLNDQGLVVLQNRWFLPTPSDQELTDGIARMVAAAADMIKEYVHFDADADIPASTLRV